MMYDTDPYGNPDLDGEPIDFDDRIVELDRERVDEDILYDLREELCAIGSEGFATLVEKEYRNVMAHESYRPTFRYDTIKGIVGSLIINIIVREQHDEYDRCKTIGDIGIAIGNSLSKIQRAEVRHTVNEMFDYIEPVEDIPVEDRVEVDAEEAYFCGYPIRPFDVLRGDQPVRFTDESKKAALQTGELRDEP
jgi:hypothetical protein